MIFKCVQQSLIPAPVPQEELCPSDLTHKGDSFSHRGNAGTLLQTGDRAGFLLSHLQPPSHAQQEAWDVQPVGDSPPMTQNGGQR
jgi:hypothetical protein